MANIKRLLRLGLEGFGTIDWIDIFYISSIASVNIINQITTHRQFVERAIYTVPFIIAVFLIHFLPFKNHVKSFVFLIFAIIIHLDQPDPDGFQSLLFFMFAFAEVPTVRTAVVVVISILSVFLYKGVDCGHSIPQSVNMIILSAYLCHRAYEKLIKPLQTKKPINLTKLTKEENKVLELLSTGLTQKEASAEMNIKHTKIAYLIKQIKDKTGYKSLYQLFHEL